jgi:hypothetical protein
MASPARSSALLIEMVGAFPPPESLPPVAASEGLVVSLVVTSDPLPVESLPVAVVGLGSEVLAAGVGWGLARAVSVG